MNKQELDAIRERYDFPCKIHGFSSGQIFQDVSVILREIDSLTAERDDLMKHLKALNRCQDCGLDGDCNKDVLKPYRNRGLGFCDRWEWRELEDRE